jgi:MFS transporter, NNP family, nitrate/nitrite transporter
MLFAESSNLTMAIITMLSFTMFLKMANGATYALTPFINPKNRGVVAGIAGAGGNIGGMLMGFLFKSSNITYGQAFFYIGVIDLGVATIVGITNFGKSPVVKPIVAADVAVESVVTY